MDPSLGPPISQGGGVIRGVRVLFELLIKVELLLTLESRTPDLGRSQGRGARSQGVRAGFVLPTLGGREGVWLVLWGASHSRHTPQLLTHQIFQKWSFSGPHHHWCRNIFSSYVYSSRGGGRDSKSFFQLDVHEEEKIFTLDA